MDEAAEPLVEIPPQKLEGKTGTLKLKSTHPKGSRAYWVVGPQLGRLCRTRLQASRTDHNGQGPAPLRHHTLELENPPTCVNPLGRGEGSARRDKTR